MNRARHLQRFGFILLALALAYGLVSAASRVPVASAQGIATPTSAILNLPTATPTMLGGPTATPSRTPSVTPVIAQALGDINLRSGPGLNYDIVGQLKAGDTVPVIGRSLQYPWYVVAWEAVPSGQAWVYQAVVQLVGDVTTLPIIEPPALPTIEPTLYAMQQTATVVLQTPGAADTATAIAQSRPGGATTVTPGLPGVLTGPLPTFTPPEPYVQPSSLVAPGTDPVRRTGIPPAVIIIALGASGLLFLGLGLLRRMV